MEGGSFKSLRSAWSLARTPGGGCSRLVHALSNGATPLHLEPLSPARDAVLEAAKPVEGIPWRALEDSPTVVGDMKSLRRLYCTRSAFSDSLVIV